MLGWLKNIFKPAYVKPHGVLLYRSVQEVIQTHKMLEKEGFKVRLIAPPPEFRVGCDLAIEFDILEQEAIEALIKKEGRIPSKIVSTKEMLPDILRRSVIIEIEGYIMCKAGNMKITIDKKEHKVVNISGGGCPDIPYVAERLYSLNIKEAPNPIEIGSSLCVYMLQIAFDALKKEVM
jgi:hypothetical protein